MRCHLGQINIICTDLDRSIAFYRDLLGFVETGREPSACHLECDGRSFLLLAVAERSREPAPYCQVAEVSLDLLVDDLQAAQRAFTAAGARFVSEFQPTADRFFIRDPDGLVLEIIRSRRIEP